MLRWNTTGITVAGITGMPGNASNRLNFPVGLVIDYRNALFVTDRGNHRIQKYLMGSSTGLTIAGQADGTLGITAEYLNLPRLALIDSDENLYIADASNNRVQFWMKGASSGTTIAGFGKLIEFSANNLCIRSISFSQFCHSVPFL